MSSIIATNFSNSIQSYSPFFTARVYDNGGFGKENFLFINTTSYLKSSTIKQFNVNLKSGTSLDKVLGSLHEINNSLLMNKAAFEDRLLTLNENVTFKSGASQLQEYQIIDAYNLWPATTRYTWDANAWVITDMNHLLNGTEKDLTKTLYNSIDSMGFYLNFKEGANRTAIAQDLSIVTGQYVHASNYEPQYWDIFNSLIFQFQIGQINTNVIMSLIIGVIILIMFAYMQLNDRKREIYTELALGMKIRQTSVLFFVESIILLVSGIIVGTVLGYSVIQMLTLFMTRGAQIPSYDVLTPWFLVLETYLGFIILAVLSAIIPAYYVTKQDISKSFITDA